MFLAATSVKGLTRVIRVQPQRNRRGLAVGDDRPREALIGCREVRRHGDGEHAPVPAGKKVRGLAHVGPARLDSIVRPDGDVERLAVIAIEIPDEKAAAAVRVGEPALERAGDAGPELPLRFAGQLLRPSSVVEGRRNQHAAGDDGGGNAANH